MKLREAMIFIAGLAIGGFVNGVIVNSVRLSEVSRCDVLAYRHSLATFDVLTGLGPYTRNAALDLMWSNDTAAYEAAAELAKGPLGDNFTHALDAWSRAGC